MQEFGEPLFTKGRVLKKESLEALRDFPMGIVQLGLAGWADGILYGFDIAYGDGRTDAGNGQVIIQAGAVWHKGKAVLTETESIPFSAYEQPVTACLKLYPASRTDDFYSRQLELRLKTGEPGEDELELGRFRLSKGARLRKDYRDLQDCRTSYNTLDVTHVPYAGPGGVTVSPAVLRTFARMVLADASAKEMDIHFAFLCLDHPPVSRECLLRYLCRRLGGQFRELTHDEIYGRLVKIAGTGSHNAKANSGSNGPAVF